MAFVKNLLRMAKNSIFKKSSKVRGNVNKMGWVIFGIIAEFSLG